MLLIFFRTENNEGQCTCKVCGKASNKKANIQNHAEIYMRVYDMIDVSAALHFHPFIHSWISCRCLVRQLLVVAF